MFLQDFNYELRSHLWNGSLLSGIPDNPAVAETFYSQFEDEFDEESEGQQDHWDHDEDTVKQKPVKLPASDEDDDDDDDDDDDIVVAERPAKPKPEKKITAKPAAKAVQNFAKPNPVAIQPYVQHRRPGQPQLGRPARPIGRLMIETVEDDPDDLEDEEALEEELDELDDEEDEDAEILREATDILSNIMVNENVEQAEEVMDMLIRDVMDDDRMVLEDIEGLVVGANGEHRRMAAEAAWEEDDGWQISSLHDDYFTLISTFPPLILLTCWSLNKYYHQWHTALWNANLENRLEFLKLISNLNWCGPVRYFNIWTQVRLLLSSLRHFLWDCFQVNAAGLKWWWITIGSCNGMLLASNQPHVLPESTLTHWPLGDINEILDKLFSN